MKFFPHVRVAALLATFIMVAGCSGPADDLVVYSGRSKALVEPLIERFEQETGLRVGVRFGDTAQLAVALTEEGRRTSADVFWAQDAGALGALQQAGLFRELPAHLLEQVDARYRSQAGTWIATSGRARTLAYSPERVEQIPQSIFDLTDERYRNRVGWAPTNASFQSDVTAMRLIEGDERTREWLIAMRNNGAKSYPRNTAIVQAIADGEIDLGLPNHYYLLRFKSEDPSFPVEQTYFRQGDAGNLLNVAGVGILEPSGKFEAAERFIAFLLSDEAQRYFAEDTFEYPVTESARSEIVLPGGSDAEANRPEIDLNALRDLEATLSLLREVVIL
jgi:iron(III) transport system substrate-binding protein